MALVKATGKYAQQRALSDEDVEQVKVLVKLGHPKRRLPDSFSYQDKRSLTRCAAKCEVLV
jgi:hypothetical protein